MNTFYSDYENKIVAHHTGKKVSKKMPLVYIVLEKIFSLLDIIIDFFSKSTVKTVVKTFSVSACFFGFIGIIGSIESGALSIGLGIVISLFLIFIEILLFRKNK